MSVSGEHAYSAGASILEEVRGALDAALNATMEASRIFEQIACNGSVAVDPFMFHLSIFVLSVLIGYYAVWSVTPALHTPLMSITNAISSVIVIGGVIATSVDFPISAGLYLSRTFGFFSVLLAMVNIFGGFLVTHRMLAMYRKNC